MRPYRISEEKFIRENIGKISCSEIGKRLGRSKNSIYKHAARMGLFATPEQVAKLREPYNFKPGNKHATKRKTRGKAFQPGCIAHNALPDGTVSIRCKTGGLPYKVIRIAGQWVRYHRYLWEQANGPIPSTHFIGFRDGDSCNCELDNLYLVSKRELSDKNRNPERISESMKHRWKIRKTKARLQKEFPNLF